MTIRHSELARTLVSVALLVSITLSPPLTVAAQETRLQSEHGQTDGFDLRQAGPIQVFGTLVEGGKVYLSIPVENYGDSPSPPVHAYAEGYTALGDLWRADGAQPTAVVIQPGETVTFRVEHDLWYGHLGVWSTYGVYLWNDELQTYLGPLGANGYSQDISFKVTLDIRQVGPIQVSGSLVEGGKVYLTIPVRNFSGTTTPAMHVYVEGQTSLGDLWRADGAQPTAVAIQPGETVNFQVGHDLWQGHAGTWQTSGVYIWNDAADDYYGPLIANGYDQQISFDVAGAMVVRQDGPIEVSGSLQQGSKVYLEIPVTNVGSEPTPPMHVYTEGYTSLDALWRADGAQPTAVVIQPGERVNFQVQHDLWYEHVGTWRTYGVHIWNDETNTYERPLLADEYSQEIEFDVANTPLASLEVDYLDDSNKAFDVSYEVVERQADGSLLVDLTVRNKQAVPFYWSVYYWGEIDDPNNSLERFSQASALPMLPRTSKTFHDVRFTSDSHLEFHFPMFGYDDDDLKFIGAVHGVQILSIAVLGFIPTGDMFETYENLISGELDVFIDAIESVSLNWLTLGYRLSTGDIRGALESLASLGEGSAEALSKASGAILKSPLSATAIKTGLTVVAYLLRFVPASVYLWDLAHSPGFAQVTITPSPRPGAESATEASNGEPSEPDATRLQTTAADSIQGNLASAQSGGEIIASSSEQSERWKQDDIIDGELSTGWATGGTTAEGEWIIIRLAGNAPALIQGVQINPGPTQDDHVGAALKAFHLDISMDGVNFDTVLQDSFQSSETGRTKEFSISPTIGRFVRLVVDTNQSDNAVNYANIAEVAVQGTAFSVDDEYEPDPSHEFARWNDAGGVAQTHNFSYPADEDWHRIQAIAGQTYLLSVTPLGDNVSATIELFGPDGSTRLHAQETSLGQAARLLWEAPATEDVFVRVSHKNTQAYGPETEYAFSVLNARCRVMLPLVIRHAE